MLEPRDYLDNVIEDLAEAAEIIEQLQSQGYDRILGWNGRSLYCLDDGSEHEQRNLNVDKIINCFSNSEHLGRLHLYAIKEKNDRWAGLFLCNL